MHEQIAKPTVAVGICDLLIPKDAKVEYGTELASTLSAHHRFAIVFIGNSFFFFFFYPFASTTESDFNQL